MATTPEKRSSKAAPREQTLLPRLLATIEGAGRFPLVAWRMIHAVEDGRGSAYNVSEILEGDLLVSRRVMRFANGAGHAQLGPVSSLTEAVYRLGSAAILKMIYTDYLRSLPWSAPIYRIESHELARHSDAVGVAAAVVARYAPDVGISRIVTVAGMMHDVGKVMIGRCMEEHGPGRLKELGGEKRLFADIERDVMGLDHSEAGSLLARRWGMPAVVSNAIHDHHRLGPENADPTSMAVALGNVIARSIGQGVAPDAREVRQSIEMTKRLGLDRDDFYKIRAEVARRLDLAGGAGLAA
jgi:putative nucleotidyltransferase with HDIG domain